MGISMRKKDPISKRSVINVFEPEKQQQHPLNKSITFSSPVLEASSTVQLDDIEAPEEVKDKIESLEHEIEALKEIIIDTKGIYCIRRILMI